MQKLKKMCLFLIKQRKVDSLEFTGKVKGITSDFLTGETVISFTINENYKLSSELEKIKDCEKLSIKAVKYRQKRSLDANNYAWQLISKLAETLGMSKDEMYVMLLKKYGSNLLYEDGSIAIMTLPSDKDPKVLGLYFSFIGNGFVNEKEFYHYRIIKGSSQYDTLEMSKFINGIVDECKDQGIETLPPDELTRMKEMWGKNDKTNT